MTQWIYKTLDYWEDSELWHWSDHLYDGQDTQQVLNVFGEQGWELVSAMPISWPDSNQEPGQTTNFQFIFKKPVA